MGQLGCTWFIMVNHLSCWDLFSGKWTGGVVRFVCHWSSISSFLCIHLFLLVAGREPIGFDCWFHSLTPLCFMLCFFGRKVVQELHLLSLVSWNPGISRDLRLYDEAKYLYPFHFYDRSPSYLSVDPNSKPGSVADAGGERWEWFIGSLGWKGRRGSWSKWCNRVFLSCFREYSSCEISQRDSVGLSEKWGIPAILVVYH